MNDAWAEEEALRGRMKLNCSSSTDKKTDG